MRHPTSGGSGFETVQSIAELICKIAGIVLICITGYYIYGVMMASDQLFRGMVSYNQPMSLADFQRHVTNLRNLMLVLQITALIGMVATLIRFYDYAEGGAVILLLGLGLAIGMPIFIDNYGGSAQGLSKALAKVANPREILRAQYVLAGLIMAVPGGLQLLIHGLMWFAGARARRPQADAEKTAQSVRKQQDKFMGKCWELPFCRDTEKKLCPVRETKQPCWRKGRGCYCDQNIILRLSGGPANPQVILYHGGGGSRPSSVVRAKSWKEKRAHCLGCPVYLHHQAQKYQVAAPGAIIGIIALFVFFRAAIMAAYPNAMLSLGRTFSGLSFGPAENGVPQWALDMGQNQGLMWMAIIVAGTLILAYSLQVVEWVLYRLGI
jgi:hypothetical protein